MALSHLGRSTLVGLATNPLSRSYEGFSVQAFPKLSSSFHPLIVNLSCLQTPHPFTSHPPHPHKTLTAKVVGKNGFYCFILFSILAWHAAYKSINIY